MRLKRVYNFNYPFKIPCAKKINFDFDMLCQKTPQKQEQFARSVLFLIFLVIKYQRHPSIIDLLYLVRILYSSVLSIITLLTYWRVRSSWLRDTFNFFVYRFRVSFCIMVAYLTFLFVSPLSKPLGGFIIYINHITYQSWITKKRA